MHDACAEPRANACTLPTTTRQRCCFLDVLMHMQLQLLDIYYLQILCVHHLHDHATRRTAAIADSRTSILALLELMEKRYENPSTRATKGMAK